ncbi:nuclear transport factor 2 family protein [Streptomyces sp. Vc74B-19]|uniref:nuclear transport factor 2 family protein n=1 Tax=Streptomyces sp. Vc74B-19 TaxID=2741324 RepID=UPI001BFC9625|nr:nuclear transport factor 2 family protein [Streptomyces sp. Vc74B-19]MBT3161579.1 nuclear transport factor 2 family protein [Streptomyces sp. Vc74B-19]
MTRTWLPRWAGAREPGAGHDPAGEGLTADDDVPGDASAEDEPGDGRDERAESSAVHDERAESSAAREGRSRGTRLRRAVAAGVAATLVLGGCGFLHAAHQLRSAESARNRALTDTEATTRVAGDVGDALARVFSYTPDGTAAAERSARTALDGRAARQYATLFDRVREDLTAQRVTLSTRAVRTGVVELDGDRARLLVFLDQTSRRGEDAATTAAAQLTVTARLEDDRWRIVDIKAR